MPEVYTSSKRCSSTSLRFASARATLVQSKSAVSRCLEMIGGSPASDCSLLILHAAAGHDFGQLAADAARQAPGAIVVGTSCGGVIGRGGAGETLREIGVMAAWGEGIAAVHATGMNDGNAVDKVAGLARTLRARLPAPSLVMLALPGRIRAADLCIAALRRELGDEVILFGSSSADALCSRADCQIFGSRAHVDSCWMLGFSAAGCSVISGMSHGLVPIGNPLEVTRCTGNRILRLNGRRAWDEYASQLGVSPGIEMAKVLPIGALAELNDDSMPGCSRIHMVLGRDADGSLRCTSPVRRGMRLWLTLQDTDRVMDEAARMAREIGCGAGSRRASVVFQTDCLVRGKNWFSKSERERLLKGMQQPFAGPDGPPPWLGTYGIRQIAGSDPFCHHYSTSICALFLADEAGTALG